MSLFPDVRVLFNKKGINDRVLFSKKGVNLKITLWPLFMDRV